MNDERLRQCLRAADPAQGSPPAFDAAAIRTLARRSARRRREGWTAGGVAAGLLLAASIVLLPERHLQPSQPPPPGVPIEARIEAEAQRLLALRRAKREAIERDTLPAAPDLADVRETAARTMVTVAPRRAAVGGARQAAVLYERTIALFPETSSARTARDALARLEPRNE